MIALFSIVNGYDQPSNNLVCLFKEKPTLEVLAKCLGEEFPAGTDELTLKIVSIWSGKEECIYSADYRLEELLFVKGIAKPEQDA